MTFVLSLKLLLIPIMAWLDRQRGTSRDAEVISKFVALVLLGYASAELLGHPLDRLTALIVAAVALAYNMPGFGQPIGAIVNPPGDANYESWQLGALRTNPTLALVFYGLFYFAAMLALYLVVLVASDVTHTNIVAIAWLLLFPQVVCAALKLALAYGIAFAAAPHLAARLVKPGNDAWALQEYLRGAIAGALLLIGGLV